MELSLIFQFGLPLLFATALLLLGFVFGRWQEKRHYLSILEREANPNRAMVFHERLPPVYPALETRLVQGSVVISADYFKRFIASLRMLVGGRLNTYESLLDRARREAILRLQAEAEAIGADQVFNIKMETCSISGRSGAGVSCLEVLAYGTALIRPK